MKPMTLVWGWAACMMAGCVYRAGPAYPVGATRPAGPPPLSSEEIVRMSRAGLSDALILEKIQSAGLVSRPTSDELASLKKEGLSDSILQAMVAAPVMPAAQQPYAYYLPGDYYPYYYGPWWYGPHWYGWPYWGWRYGYYRYPYGWHYPYRGPVIHP